MPTGVLDRLIGDGRVVVLDGGLGTELESRGADLADRLWSARLLADQPEAIVEAHLAFFRAGAQVATTASYQATFEGFAAAGIEAAEAASLIGRSVALAIEARRRFTIGEGSTADLLVAASVGPYGAMLADGSEYSGDYGLSVAELREFHRPRLEILAASDADLLALETIPSLDEARALVELLGEVPAATAWLTFSCADGAHTRRGDPVEEAFDLADEAPRVVALGVNCTEPRFIEELVERAAGRTTKPIVVYPNAGERWDGRGRRWSGAPADHLWSGVGGWLEAGARIVGGCCRVGPREIAELAAIVAG
jgi:homocysteine S-methyltransferase